MFELRLLNVVVFAVKRKVFISGSRSTTDERGVVYLSNVPHGFYENQMFKFFSQFGKVTNLRLGRSKKTGENRQQ